MTEILLLVRSFCLFCVWKAVGLSRTACASGAIVDWPWTRAAFHLQAPERGLFQASGYREASHNQINLLLEVWVNPFVSPILEPVVRDRAIFWSGRCPVNPYLPGKPWPEGQFIVWPPAGKLPFRSRGEWLWQEWRRDRMSLPVLCGCCVWYNRMAGVASKIIQV